jgi:hypothetical protein
VNAVIVRGGIERGIESVKEFLVQRVQRTGPVERESSNGTDIVGEQDPAVGGFEEVVGTLVGHGGRMIRA